MIRRHFIDIPVVFPRLFKFIYRKNLWKAASLWPNWEKLVGAAELYLNATTLILPPAITFGQVRCKIKGPNCGRLAMERHLTPFDAMNRGYSETPLPHSCQKKCNTSLCVKNGTNCALVTDDRLFTILSNMSFHNLLVCCPCLRQGPGSGYAPALAHFRTRFCLQVNFEAEISYPGQPLLHTHKGVAEEGTLQCIHPVLVLLVGRAAEHVGRS
jgi:hypothetical protein